MLAHRSAQKIKKTPESKSQHTEALKKKKKKLPKTNTHTKNTTK